MGVGSFKVTQLGTIVIKTVFPSLNPKPLTGTQRFPGQGRRVHGLRDIRRVCERDGFTAWWLEGFEVWGFGD